MADDEAGLEQTALEQHAERAKQRAALRAANASLTVIESQMLVNEARQRRAAARLLREQLTAARRQDPR